MPDVIELLERLAETPPALPRPPDELRTRATHRRRRRQRRRTVAGAAVALATVLVAVVLVVQEDDRPRVSSGPPTAPTSGLSDTPPTLDQAIGGLTVSPSTGLRDGDTVTLELDPDPGGELVASQCVAEVLEFADAEQGDITGTPAEWCGPTYNLRSPAGRSDLTVPVTRLQRAGGQNFVDCTDQPGRCVLMVDDMTTSRRPGHVGTRFAPLDFEQTNWLPRGEVRLVDVDEPIADGALVEVEVEGMTPNATSTLVQCTGPAEEECDQARPSMEITADASGRVNTELRIYHDIWTSTAGDWTACEPCLLTTQTNPELSDTATVDVEATDDPIHPALSIVEDPPYAPGQTVTVEGEGFQTGQQVGLGWCRGGVPASCTYPGEWPTVGDDGRFTSEYTLPSATAAADCIATPGRCAIAWGPSQEGAPMLVELPIDLSG